MPHSARPQGLIRSRNHGVIGDLLDLPPRRYSLGMELIAQGLETLPQSEEFGVTARRAVRRPPETIEPTPQWGAVLELLVAAKVVDLANKRIAGLIERWKVPTKYVRQPVVVRSACCHASRIAPFASRTHSNSATRS